MESVDSHYINISNFRHLLQTSYIKFPVDLRGTKRALINIKNNDLKCFIWCHISNINLIKIPPEVIIQKDKEIINDPDYKRNKFTVSKKNSIKIETKNKTYQIKNLKIQWIYCVYLMKINHTVSTSKILTDSGSIKQETKTKNTFAKDAYTVLVIKMYSQGIIIF